MTTLRLAAILLLSSVVVLPAPVRGDAAADIGRIFGRDPGQAAAHACFVRRYTKAHLAGHPDQNVTDMLAFVSKQEGPDAYYSISMQVNFRQLAKPFQLSGSCGIGVDGKNTLGCGIECDGGSLSVRVKNDMSLLVDIPDSVRLFDPSDLESEPGADLPQGARFGADDKLFRLDRTDLRDCTPVIYDEAVKAKVMQGVTTQ